MKLILTGSTSFTDYNRLEERLKKHKNVSTVITGKNNGTEKMVVRWCQENDIPYKQFEESWELYGMNSIYKKNREMLKEGDAAILFWDGVSLDTKHLISIAKEYSIEPEVIIV